MPHFRCALDEALGTDICLRLWQADDITEVAGSDSHGWELRGSGEPVQPGNRGMTGSGIGHRLGGKTENTACVL